MSAIVCIPVPNIPIKVGNANTDLERNDVRIENARLKRRAVFYLFDPSLINVR